MRRQWWTAAATVVGLVLVVGPAAVGQEAVSDAPVERAECGPGSNPEPGRQGRVPPEAYTEAGGLAEAFTCNMEMLGHDGIRAGFKVERYVDAQGNECAYYDSTAFFPLDVSNQEPGTYVLDMNDPTNPVRTTFLATPAMSSPHESLVVNHERGLLAAVLGNPFFYPGAVDIYDISQDCAAPDLMASAPVGVLGHESGFAPDGLTFYAAGLSGGVVTAIDVTNPRTPNPIWVGNYQSHGITVSDDGNTLYMTAVDGAGPDGDAAGIILLDVSEVQARVPNPEVTVISTLTWPEVAGPQIAHPVTIDGHPYLIEMDEYANGFDQEGAARIIDIADPADPFVVSNIHLEVNQVEHREEQAGDPAATDGLRGYAGHYCNVPRRVDPGIVACTFITSGLRVFDIRDPFNPREIAYYNAALDDGNANPAPFAMSSPTFVPERGEIWYSDAATGFYALRVTNDVWPFPDDAPAPDPGTPAPAVPDPAPTEDAVPDAGTAAPAPTSSAPGAGPGMPATGNSRLVGLGLLALVGLVAIRRRR